MERLFQIKSQELRKMHVLVIGASLKPRRYSYKAMELLREYGHTVSALGRTEGEVAGVPIDTEPQKLKQVHTVTMYLRPELQKEYYDYVLSLKPKRVIFNPGTENDEFASILAKKKIYPMEACTLVLLRTNQFEEDNVRFKVL